MSRRKFGSYLAGCMYFGFFFLLCMQPSVSQNETDNATALQTPSAVPTGELLYSDDFSSSKSGWPINSIGGFLESYKKGMYRITIGPEEYWDGVLAPRQNLSDFIVKVDATKEAGPDDNVFGIQIRNREPGSLYAFLISSDGYYEIAKKVNYTWVTPSNWTKSGAIKTGNATNLIAVTAIKDKFAFYANDVLLADYSDDSLAYGGVGLFDGSQSEGNVTIAFDNFSIWKLNG
jgi:hypothetical protein